MPNNPPVPHPYLSNSGSCQSERYPALLNPGSVKIDDLKLDDILQFINKYSRFINFYDEDYNISNWQALFAKSVPFQIAALGKLDVDELEENFARILQLTDEFPAQDNFQTLIDFIFTELVLVFENSLKNIGGIDTPFSVALQRIMSANLRAPLLAFIAHTKELSELTGIEGITFNTLITVEYWDIPAIDTIDSSNLTDIPSLILALENNANVLINELRGLASQTAQFLPASLYPNEESRTGKITPHIGLLIAFLALQEKFKVDLNDITRRHLLYFYEDVLQIKGKPARPDETFVYFELQKQINTSYLVSKGTKVKDGKDDNKADIVFALEKDVVLDKAKIKELRTLYLNPVQGYLPEASPDGCVEDELETFVEGLYIAPKANSADGVEEDFKEEPKNWATLGARESKLLQQDESYKDHPEARVGFVLASPVLLLNEGKRTIDVTLYCNDPGQGNQTDKAIATLFGTRASNSASLLSRLIVDKESNDITELQFDEILVTLWSGQAYVDFAVVLTEENASGELITTPLFEEDQPSKIIEALGLLPEEEGGEIAGFFYDIQQLVSLIQTPSVGLQFSQSVFLVNQIAFNNQTSTTELNLDDEFDVLLSSYLYVKPFRIYLSGEEAWLQVASKDVNMQLVEETDDDSTYNLLLTFQIELQDDFPAVTFSNPEILGIEVGTDQPAMKVEIDPNYKVLCPSHLYQPCCTLEHCKAEEEIKISPYHFLKDLKVVDSCIEVEVCGVKNLIVQNDESVQDVNGLIYPFGARPTYEKNAAAPYSAQGSNFYIGSQELFCKNWQEFNVNINWKDKPVNFCEYYIGYEDLTKGITDIDGDRFKIKTALLENGEWKDFNPSSNLKQRNEFLFNPDDDTNGSRNNPSAFCNRPVGSFQRVFDFQRINNADFANLQYRNKELEDKFDAFSVDSRDAFLRLTLTGLDFQHNQYAFILARQMMAFGKLDTEGKSVYVPGAVYFIGDLKNNNGVFSDIKSRVLSLSEIITTINQITDYLFLMGTNPLDNNGNLKVCNSTPPVVQGSLYQKILQLITDLGAAINGAIDLQNINFQGVDVGPGPPDSLPDIKKVIFDILSGLGIVATINDSTVTSLNNAIGAEIDNILTTIFPNGVINPSVIQSVRNGMISTNPANPSDIIDKGDALYNAYLNEVKALSIKSLFKEVQNFLCSKGALSLNAELSGAVIPNEPWTPIIKDISIDYTAKAEATDIELVHLYPFEGTYKTEEITASPALLPMLEDEGTLFLAFDNVTRGNTLNLLFNFAEATANTEMSKPDISWAYLKNNNWEELRPGFDLLHDGTDGFTKTGIVEIAVPLDISNQGHTIMPTDAYWIKAAAKQNSKAVCETISIHTQAAKVIAELSPDNDRQRLRQPLEVDKISKLSKADTSIKKIAQPVPSFNGRPPEGEVPELLYRRISEGLRHKGRAIASFDYERIVLENFSQVFKAKTVSHTLGLSGSKYIRDMEVAAPGHVLVAVIPDIKKLNGGNALEPRVPLSQLSDIKKLLQQKNSPFIKLKVLNPRYEKVNVAIKVKFKTGNTGEYYKKLLVKDIEYFLAPWTKGSTDRLQFGGILSRSELIAFVEQLSYVDYICHIDWVHEFDLDDTCKTKLVDCEERLSEVRSFISPLTARSILTAGKISVCELNRPCESYDNPLIKVG